MLKRMGIMVVVLACVAGAVVAPAGEPHPATSVTASGPVQVGPLELPGCC